MAKALAQITIYDVNDIISSPSAPTSPVKDQCWLDTSLTPPVMKVWNGSKWVIENDWHDDVNKVQQQVTTTTERLNTATSDISVLKGQIALKVEQSDIDKTVTTVKNELVTKIDGIEVGGRNLLVNSDREVTNNGKPRGEFVSYADIAPIIDKYGLVEYTLSFDLKASKNGSVQVYCQNGSGAKYNIGNTNILITTEYKRYSITVIPKISDGTLSASMLAFYSGYGTSIFPYIKNVKIEKGNKSTDWTPAPEDIDKSIADVITTTDTKIVNAKAEIKAETDKINLSVTNLTTKTNTIETQLGDKATKSEVKTVSDKATSIEANLNGITQRVSSTESNLSTVTSTANTALDKINTIEIGNKNILKDSGKVINSTGYLIKVYNTWINLKPATKYTIVFEGNVNDPNKFGIWFNGAANHVAYFNKESSGLYRAVITSPNSITNNTVSFYNYPSSSAFNGTIKWACLYEGDVKVPLDWTPAPEDVQSQIDAHTTEINTTNSKVAEIKTTTDTISSRVSSVESATTTINGQVTNQETRLRTAESKITDSAIMGTISNQLKGSGKIETSNMLFNNTGLEISHSEIGTKTLMTAKGFKILNSKGEEVGSLADEFGLTILRADEVYANNIYTKTRYDSTYYIDYKYGFDGKVEDGYGTNAKPFKTVNHLIDICPKFIEKGATMYIYIKTNTYESIVIQNFMGFGKIRLYISKGVGVYAPIRVQNCTTNVYIEGYKTYMYDNNCGVIDISGYSSKPPAAIYCETSTYVRVQGLNIKSNSSNGVQFESVAGLVMWCDINYCNSAIASYYGANVYIEDCCGSNNNIGVETAFAGIAHAGHPSGSKWNIPQPNKSINIGGMFNFGSGVVCEPSRWLPPPAPSTKIYETTWGATSTKTWGTMYGWDNDSNALRQGNYGYGNRRGFMYFDASSIRSSLSGASIHSIQLRLRRNNSGGNSGGGSVYLYGHGYTSGGGGNSLSTNYGNIGTWAWGEDKWVSLPSSVGEAFKNGSIQGLAMWSDSGSPYMVFEGFAELWIKYEK